MADAKRRFLILAAATAFRSLHADSSVVGELSLLLDTNAVIEVSAGEEKTIEVLSGKRGTLTKKGEGTLRIGSVRNKNVRYEVEEGRLLFYRYVPRVCEKAFFHVDASFAESLVTEEVGGTNFVVRWNDVRNNGMFATNCLYSPSWRPNPENRRAFISQVRQNGLPVVDFGTMLFPGYTNELGEVLGYGATMIWNSPCPEAREIYEVISDTPDVISIPRDHPQFADRIHAVSFISSSKGRAGNYREHLTASEYPNIFYDNSNNNGWMYGNIYRDGTLVDANKHGKSGKFSPGAGFHVFGFTSREYNEEKKWTDYSAVVDSFARDYNNSCGAQRIGEYLVFTNRLSDAERKVLHDYLTEKWKGVPYRVRASAVNVGDEASVEFASGVPNCISAVNGGADVAFLSGEVELNPLKNPDAFFHVDASDAATLALEEVNGTNFVVRWDDVISNGVYATPRTTAVGTYLPDPENRRPFISGETLNGRSVVDFGSLLVPSHTNENGYGIGYGASMKWNKRMTEGCMELCAVMRDTEDIKTLVGNSNVKDGKERGPAYVCDPEGTRGYRGYISAGKYPPPSHDNSYNAPVNKGKILFDGVSVAYKSGIPPEGYHVVNLQMKNGEYKNNEWTYLTLFKPQWFGYMRSKDSKYSYGGTRIAEYIIFPNALSNDVRTAIYSAFRTKWFGEDRQTLSFRNLSLGPDVKLDVPWQNVSVSGRLSIGGRINVESVSVSDVELLDEAEISGSLSVAADATVAVNVSAGGATASLQARDLALAGGGKVSISLPEGVRMPVGEFAVLTGKASFMGSPEGWRLDTSAVRTASVSLHFRNDGLYLSSRPLGTTIVVR